MKILFPPLKAGLFTLTLTALMYPSTDLTALENIAMVKGAFDDVDTVLANYRIPHHILTMKDLEDIEILKKYKSIYFPSGIEKPIYENINLLSMGTKIQSVNIKKDYYELNRAKIIDNLKNFIESGGAAYFSGYSFTYIQEAYASFEFFDGFPYMGIPGRIVSSLKNDLRKFSETSTAPLYISFPGWVTVKSAANSEVMADAEYETARGNKTGPITLLIKKGDGEILYTSYYSTVFSDFRRFNIYRVAGNQLFKKLEKIARSYGQNITGRIADSMMQGEFFRTYNFTLEKGNNTIYFLTEGDYYQVDIYDSRMALIQSIDRFDSAQSFDIRSGKEETCFVRLFPSGDKRYGIFALISAAGKRYFPYYTIIISAVFFLIVLISIIFLFRIFGRKKYSGRF